MIMALMQVRLRELRQALDAIGDQPQWSDWKKIEAWASSARPFIRQFYPTHATRFDTLVAEPRWVQIAIHGTSDVGDHGVRHARQRVEERENARFVSLKREWIFEFLDDLARLDADEPANE